MSSWSRVRNPGIQHPTHHPPLTPCNRHTKKEKSLHCYRMLSPQRQIVLERQGSRAEVQMKRAWRNYCFKLWNTTTRPPKQSKWIPFRGLHLLICSFWGVIQCWTDLQSSNLTLSFVCFLVFLLTLYVWDGIYMDSRTASIHPACFHMALKLGISKVFVKLQKKKTQQKFLLQAQHFCNCAFFWYFAFW